MMIAQRTCEAKFGMKSEACFLYSSQLDNSRSMLISMDEIATKG